MKNLLYVLALGALTVVPMQAEITAENLKDVKTEILNLSNIAKQTERIILDNPNNLPKYWASKYPEIERVVTSIQENLPQLKNVVVDLLTREAVADKIKQFGGDAEAIKVAIDPQIDNLNNALSRFLSYLSTDNMNIAAAEIAKLSPEQINNIFVMGKTTKRGVTTIKDFYTQKIEPSVKVIDSIDPVTLANNIDGATRNQVLPSLRAMLGMRKIIGASATILKNFVVLLQRIANEVQDPILDQIQQRAEQVIKQVNAIPLM